MVQRSTARAAGGTPPQRWYHPQGDYGCYKVQTVYLPKITLLFSYHSFQKLPIFDMTFIDERWIYVCFFVWYPVVNPIRAFYANTRIGVQLIHTTTVELNCMFTKQIRAYSLLNTGSVRLLLWYWTSISSSDYDFLMQCRSVLSLGGKYHGFCVRLM